MVPIPQTGRGPSASTSNTLPICDRNACQELEGKNRVQPFKRIPVAPLNSLQWSVITKTACRSTFTEKPQERSYGFPDNYDGFVCAHGWFKIATAFLIFLSFAFNHCASYPYIQWNLHCYNINIKYVLIVCDFIALHSISTFTVDLQLETRNSYEKIQGVKSVNITNLMQTYIIHTSTMAQHLKRISKVLMLIIAHD